LASGVAAQVTPKRARLPSADATVRLEAEQQRKEGDFFFADGNVEILYRNYRLRADHVQYNAKLTRLRCAAMSNWMWTRSTWRRTLVSST